MSMTTRSKIRGNEISSSRSKIKGNEMGKTRGELKEDEEKKKFWKREVYTKQFEAYLCDSAPENIAFCFSYPGIP